MPKHLAEQFEFRFMRKIYLKVTTNVVIRADEGVDLQKICENLTMVGTSETSAFDVEDVTLFDVQVTNSK